MDSNDVEDAQLAECMAALAVTSAALIEYVGAQDDEGAQDDVLLIEDDDAPAPPAGTKRKQPESAPRVAKKNKAASAASIARERALLTKAKIKLAHSKSANEKAKATLTDIEAKYSDIRTWTVEQYLQLRKNPSTKEVLEEQWLTFRQYLVRIQQYFDSYDKYIKNVAAVTTMEAQLKNAEALLKRKYVPTGEL